jgi:ribosome-associated heat shock protein Hsp15
LGLKLVEIGQFCIRLFKTRSLAGEQVKSGRVLMGDLPVKASRELKPGDVFTIKRHGFDEVFEVLALPKARIGAKLVPEYLKNRTPSEELEKEAFLKFARSLSRQKGLGRPTKKERRDMDHFLDDEIDGD